MRLAGLMVLLLLYAPIWALGQAEAGHAASTKTVAVLTPAALESEFFAVVREGDALKFLSYISEEGVNLGRDAQHASRDAVEEQLTHRTGLYCKLFDTACLNDGDCSYRELLTQSEKVRTAASEITRNQVRQAILVAQVQNQKCGGTVLIDFIFNQRKDGWKLFSIP